MDGASGAVTGRTIRSMPILPARMSTCPGPMDGAKFATSERTSIRLVCADAETSCLLVHVMPYRVQLETRQGADKWH